MLPTLVAAQDAKYDRKRDVIYARKFGTVLTMDVFAPKEKVNGAGIIFVCSGGFVSNHDFIRPEFCAEYLKRGYVVFGVVHGSQPKFTIPEIVDDLHRAVRFIRTHAKDYGVDPDKLGITGISAVGHLSLMMGTSGKEGDPKARDPIDRASSKVQAVACFCPPTDFLNYGEPGKEALGAGVLAAFRAPFDFKEFNGQKGTFERVSDEKARDIGKQVSPVTHANSGDAPSRIFHGDNDKLVPIQQAESIVKKLQEAGVPAELIVRKGADHTWPTMIQDFALAADWFDKYLLNKPAPESK
jgi:acetyl esterase/lipase